MDPITWHFSKYSKTNQIICLWIFNKIKLTQLPSRLRLICSCSAGGGRSYYANYNMRIIVLSFVFAFQLRFSVTIILVSDERSNNYY